MKDRVESGLDIAYNGILVLMAGIGYLAQGVHDFMGAEESALLDLMEYYYHGYVIVPWGTAHTLALVGIVAAIALIIHNACYWNVCCSCSVGLGDTSTNMTEDASIVRIYRIHYPLA